MYFSLFFAQSRELNTLHIIYIKTNVRRLFCTGLSLSITTVVSGPALFFLNMIAPHISAITIRKLWKDTCLLLTKPGNYTVHLEPHSMVIVGAVSLLAGAGGSVDVHRWCQQGQSSVSASVTRPAEWAVTRQIKPGFTHLLTPLLPLFGPGWQNNWEEKLPTRLFS